MAYTTAELEEYWNTVQDGSVLDGAAPAAFEDSATFTPDQTEDLQNIRDTSYSDRQAAMDWTDQYNYDPAQAELLSDRLSGVLEEDSPYIQRARLAANEAAGAQGLLNSSMAAGAAEGAAIDRGLNVAQGDVDVDKFNVGAENEALGAKYAASQDIAGTTQEFQNQLGASEAGYIFNTGLEETKQENTLELEDVKQEDALELADANHILAMETDMLKYTNDRAIELLSQQSDLQKTYLSAYAQIAAADISAADKNAQLASLASQIDNAVLASRQYADLEIVGVDNFGISIPEYTPGDYTSGAVPVTDEEAAALAALTVDEQYDRINALYVEYLGRSVNPDYDLTDMYSQTDVNIINGMTSSDEYAAKQEEEIPTTDVNPDDRINAIFQEYLGRDVASASDITAFYNMTDQQIIDIITGSAEYTGTTTAAPATAPTTTTAPTAVSTFEDLLGRTPSDPSVWEGLTVAEATAIITGSAEYQAL